LRYAEFPTGAGADGSSAIGTNEGPVVGNRESDCRGFRLAAIAGAAEALEDVGEVLGSDTMP
jgi:hypothetical protein